MLSPPHILWMCVIFLYQGMQTDGSTMLRDDATRPIAETTNKHIKGYSEPEIFHSVVKGNNVVLSNNALTATRKNPIEDYGHSGVVTQRPLNDGETFMVRIDKTVDAHNENGVVIGLTEMPPNAEIPETLILHRNGTWCIYSRYGQVAGYSCTVKDTKALSISYPIDTRYLPVGTTLGVRRMGNGDVHFFVNGIDKGVAFNEVPNDVHGFVDVANYVSEVSIIDQ